MLIDSLMKFMEDEAFTTNAATGTIDLTGLITYGTGNDDATRHGRGTGSPLLVHTVIEAVGGTLTAMTGTFSAILKIEDATPATTVVATVVFPATLWTENAGVHAVFAIPYDVQGRYATLTIGDTSLVGGGSGNLVTAWVFAQ
jgi:hypothetical protein